MAMLLSSVTSAHVSYEQASHAAKQAALAAQAHGMPAGSVKAHGVHKSKRNLLG
jgi:hypothetical protein